jgi:hypothetical protein
MPRPAYMQCFTPPSCCGHSTYCKSAPCSRKASGGVDACYAAACCEMPRTAYPATCASCHVVAAGMWTLTVVMQGSPLTGTASQMTPLPPSAKMGPPCTAPAGSPSQMPRQTTAACMSYLGRGLQPQGEGVHRLGARAWCKVTDSWTISAACACLRCS